MSDPFSFCNPFELPPEDEAMLFALIDQAPDDPQAWLRQHCGDPERRARLLALYGAHQASRPEPPTLLIDERIDSACGGLAERPRQIGDWQLIGPLGQGGMSTVYLARRDSEEFEQLAAIKVLAAGLAAPALIQRFANERRILARLEHARIARLIDGGVSEQGLPYLAMEYVQGQTLDAWCQDQRLDVQARLDLVAQVLEGLQYAHRNLVVHRDIKPSNILVTAEGQVKLLDFGIAKVLDTVIGQGESSELTRLAGRPMTPAWASPEQIAGEPVTVATDIYSVGLLLYRLLTGSSPWRGKADNHQALERAIIEQAPLPPSQAVRQSDPDAPGDAPPGRRERLARLLSGDLDTIILTCLRKEPERRYATAEQLAADLRRYRQRLPITARPDDIAYRAGRFLARHRIGVGLTAVAALTLAAGLTLHTQRLQTERDRAELAASQAALEAAKSRQVADYLISLFRAADPTAESDQTLTAVDLVERGMAQVDSLADSPAVQAEMLRVFGGVHEARGQHREAMALYERALAALDLHGSNATELRAGLKLDLAFSRFNAGDYAAALEAIEQTLADAGNQPLLRAQALNLRGNIARDGGRVESAELDYRQALDLFRQMPDQRSELATVLINLGTVLTLQRRLLSAGQMYREALDIRRATLGDEHPWTTIPEGNLAWILMETGNLDEAETLYRKALRLRLASFGEDHPRVGVIRYQLGQLSRKQARWAEAQAELEAAERIFRTTVGTSHRQWLVVSLTLGELALDRGHHEAAAPVIANALQGFREIHANAHTDTARALTALARLAQAQGDSAAAQSHFEAALAERRALDRQEHEVIDALLNLAEHSLVHEPPGSGQRYLDEALTLIAGQPEISQALAERRQLLARQFGRTSPEPASTQASDPATVLPAGQQ